MKIAEYKTATGETAAALDKEVNRLLGQGFQLYGAPYALRGAGGAEDSVAAQALIKLAMMEKYPPAEASMASVIAP
jgi:hypothetical protein